MTYTKLSPETLTIDTLQVCMHLPSVILLTAVYAPYTLHVPIVRITITLDFSRLDTDRVQAAVLIFH